MAHNHDHSQEMGKRLLLAMLINLLIPVAQIAGGMVAGSMALISDAVHNLGDFTSLLIAYAAHMAGKKGPSLKHTFGMQRMEVLAAVVNVALLGGAAVYIAIEAISRLASPAPVELGIVAWMAMLGIVGNGLSALILHRDSMHNLNARGAFLHMVGDLMTSVAVLVGAVVMRFVDAPWIDPALSLAIVAYIAASGFSLLKDAVHVLMDGTPRGLDLNQLKAEIESIDEVQGIHYLHAWSVGGRSVAMTCHVVVPDQPISATENISVKIARLLMEKFDIDHPVLQFETRECGTGELLCGMTCRSC